MWCELREGGRGEGSPFSFHWIWHYVLNFVPMDISYNFPYKGTIKYNQDNEHLNWVIFYLLVNLDIFLHLPTIYICLILNKMLNKYLHLSILLLCRWIIQISDTLWGIYMIPYSTICYKFMIYENCS